MLTPRLRRRLSELARSPTPQAQSSRGGSAAPPSSPARPADPPRDSPPELGPPTSNAEAPAPSTRLLVLAFDPQAHGAEREMECGRCFHLALPLAPYLEDGAE